MKLWNKTFLAGLCCAAVFSLTAFSTVHAEPSADPLAPVLVYGPVVREGGNRLHMTNNNQNALKGELVITVSEETTRILDATTGLPVAFDDIRDQETVYAYIGPAIAMSLPPIGNASVVLCRIPADYKVPEYLEVASLERNGQTAILTATNGSRYTITTDSQLLPYLTRNLVTLDDLAPGKTCLLWSSAGSDQADRIVIFPEVSAENSGLTTGWIQDNGNWYYYNSDGNRHSGWLLENGDWYYLDPETQAMRTGFLTVDGNTYYLQDNGKMLTKAKMFTPDENGALH